MNTFLKEFELLLAAQPFCGNQRTLALHTGIDRAHLNRVYKGKNLATPEFVGRLCGTLPADQAARLLKAFLDDVLAATAAAKPTTKPIGKWRTPLSDLSLSIGCKVKKVG